MFESPVFVHKTDALLMQHDPTKPQFTQLQETVYANYNNFIWFLLS